MTQGNDQKWYGTLGAFLAVVGILVGFLAAMQPINPGLNITLVFFAMLTIFNSTASALIGIGMFLRNIFKDSDKGLGEHVKAFLIIIAVSSALSGVYFSYDVMSAFKDQKEYRRLLIKHKIMYKDGVDAKGDTVWRLKKTVAKAEKKIKLNEAGIEMSPKGIKKQ